MTKNPNLVPISILLAGLVLSLTVYAVRHEDAPEAFEGDVTRVLPVGTGDHLMGSSDAEVTIITYTDFDCEYCKRFHEVMEQVMTEYEPGGRVAWVVRHFPIIDLHPYSGTHAKAAECAAKLGGEPLFWRFISVLHANAPGGDPFNPEGYPGLVASLGLPEEAFISCTKGNEFEDRVARDFENGLMIGAKGAPFSVVVMEGTEPLAISGYVPYDGMKTVIEAALDSTR